MSPCPHCGGTTIVERHAALRWTCGVCGGPIVPADVELARSNAELASLVRAKRTRAIAFGWTAAAIVLSLSALMAFGLGALLLLVAKLAPAILGGLGVVLGAMAWSMRGRARAADATSQRELDAAWESVAAEIVRARGNVTSAELARIMRTTEAHAEALLAATAVHADVRVDVGEDAELRYSSARVDDERVRVAGDTGVRVADDDAEHAPGARARAR